MANENFIQDSKRYSLHMEHISLQKHNNKNHETEQSKGKKAENGPIKILF